MVKNSEKSGSFAFFWKVLMRVRVSNGRRKHLFWINLKVVSTLRKEEEQEDSFSAVAIFPDIPKMCGEKKSWIHLYIFLL